jgi:hypothetical protein
MEKDNRKKFSKDVTNHTANQIGNMFSNNVQHGTDAAERGMELFLKKTNQIGNVGYEQAKGNLFEYIETAKINRNLANKGINRHYEATDAKKEWGGLGEPHAPDDFRGFQDGKVIARGQAKINNNPNKTAGSDKGITNPKYKGMQRNVASDKYDDVLKALDEKYAKGEISKDAYVDAKANLRRGLTDEDSGVSSGGTSTKELNKAATNPEGYARDFRFNQYAREVGTTSVNMAASNMVMTGIIKTTSNLFEVFQNRKELDEAMKDIGVEVVKSGARGGATGFLSSILRIGGRKAAIPVISDASAATTIAGGVIDCGVSVYAYAQGEISAEELKESLQNTAIKSVATIYFTKSIELVVGTANPFLPMAIYTAASYVVINTREIIKNAKLNTEEYNRIASLYEKSTKQMIEYRKIIEGQLIQYVKSEKEMLNSFIDTYEFNITTGENYDKAIYAIVNFSNQYGLALKHVDFGDFKAAMLSNDDFVL